MERPDDNLDIWVALNQGEFRPLMPTPLSQDMILVSLHLPVFDGAAVIAAAA